MRSTFIFPCITTMISNDNFCLPHIYFQFFLYKFYRFLHLHMIPAALLLIPSFFFFLNRLSLILIACSPKNLQNFFMQSLRLYTSCLFSMLFKWQYCRPWKTWWNILAWFCCRWIFRIVVISINSFYYIVKICIDNKWCFIRFLKLIKFYYSSVFRWHNYITKYSFSYTFFYLNNVFCLF